MMICGSTTAMEVKTKNDQLKLMMEGESLCLAANVGVLNVNIIGFQEPYALGCPCTHVFLIILFELLSRDYF